MEFFHTIRLSLGIILFAGLGINFFYRGIKALIKLRKINYSEETIHTFKCRNCEEIYEMSGVELKDSTTIWSTRLETRTPISQTNAIRFECPVCYEKAFQEKIYDTDVTEAFGNVRAQFDENTRSILLEVLIKGFLPILIGMPILGWLL